MKRETEFVQSHRPYAVDLATVTGAQSLRLDVLTFNGRANAVWYRRQEGVTRACVGTLKLWSHRQRAPLNPDDPMSILTADLDGRYGGECLGRWDGSRYWGAQRPEVIEQHLALLRPMLAAYPAAPEGYDGWWTFR